MTLSSIVFYDGLCKFCNISVQVLLRIDKNHRLTFSPLQGKTARRLLSDQQRLNLDSIIFYYRGQSFEKSTAILKILKTIGGPWGIFYLAILVPRVIRDLIYDLIATYRYSLFGKVDQCKIPNPKQRAQFLD